MIDFPKIYAVSIAAILVLLLSRWASRRVAPYYPGLRAFLLRKIVYPVLIRRCRWTSVTYLQFALLGVYVFVNGLFMSLGVHGVSDLMRRSSLMSSVNMVPLFLGGRTNVLFDRLGIPLQTYYLAHHWIGRMSIVQSLLHAGLAISSHWAYDTKTISGLTVTLALALLLLTSFYFIRGIAFEVFLIMHRLLALTVVGGTIWNIIPGEFKKLLFITISISVWSMTTVYRLIQISLNKGRISSYNSYNGLGDPRLCAIKFTVRVPWHLRAVPGQYVYLYFSGLRWQDSFQAHPFNIMWCEYELEGKDDKNMETTSLTFLVQARRGLTARLSRELQLHDLTQRPICPIKFDGPYGQDLHLERYETVMLVAEGAGIAGVLHYAQQSLACGSAPFTQHIRCKVLEILSKDNFVRFSEVEYRPLHLQNGDGYEPESARPLRMRQALLSSKLSDESERVELAHLPRIRNVLSKPPQLMKQTHGNTGIENAPSVSTNTFV